MHELGITRNVVSIDSERASGQKVLLSKTDLLPHLRVDLQRMIDNALQVNPRLKIFPVSAYTGQGPRSPWTATAPWTPASATRRETGGR